ncbi:VOC family protein [Devosia ginsengisoli]|uniref:VOC family protein n=1 Tax=Devosia ginsengisoli TaxID=400770 RepID=UPI0026EC232F|nr:VOC family protein [Devosia ginsengisoli]MCR6670801.1 VOC family protein [Devosia ginsengisoli]
MIIGIDHIELIVRDAEEFVEFYQKMGFKLLRWTEHHGRSAELQLPGENQPIFEIHTVTGEENPGINHISFRCQDIESTYAALTANGLPMTKPKLSDTGRKNAAMRDPDGWRLQFSDSQRGEIPGNQEVSPA